MANKQRGEVGIKLGGATYTMTPSFGVLADISDTLDIGFVELIHRFEHGKLGMRQIATIIWIAIKEKHPDCPDIKEIGATILKEKIDPHLFAIKAFLFAAASGGKDLKKFLAAVEKS